VRPNSAARLGAITSAAKKPAAMLLRSLAVALAFSLQVALESGHRGG
jgi:hypothetical protein